MVLLDQLPMETGAISHEILSHNVLSSVSSVSVISALLFFLF